MRTQPYDTRHHIGLCAGAARSPFALLAESHARAQRHAMLHAVPVRAVAAGVVALAIAGWLHAIVDHWSGGPYQP